MKEQQKIIRVTFQARIHLFSIISSPLSVFLFFCILEYDPAFRSKHTRKQKKLRMRCVRFIFVSLHSCSICPYTLVFCKRNEKIYFCCYMKIETLNKTKQQKKHTNTYLLLSSKIISRC